MTTINERIKLIRKNLGLTQTQFGKDTGISQGHLTAIENGKREVTEKTAKVICLKYGVSEKYLLNGEGDMFFLLDETTEFMRNVADIAYDEDKTAMEIVNLYKKMTPEHKKLFSAIVRGMEEVTKKGD